MYNYKYCRYVLEIFFTLQCDMIRHSSIRQPNIMTRARQKAFDLGLKDFIVVSARSGYGMEELLGRIVTLVRTVYVACICETTYT